MKVWHINNIAEVGPILVVALQRLGVNARFFDVAKPFPFRHFVIKLFGIFERVRSARSLVRQARAENVDVLHVHYSTTAIWFLFSGIPMVVHFHGGDARFSRWNILGHLINWLVCKNAALILYSTPDLGAQLSLYTRRARFSPNPMDLDVFTAPNIARDPNLIFLNFALREIKGASTVYQAVVELKKRYPQLRFRSFGFGDRIEQARAAGVEIINRVGRAELPAILAQAGLILGQVEVGAVGMSELEDLALGHTAVCHFQWSHVYPEPPPFVQARTSDDIVESVAAYVENPGVYAPLDARARAWVMKFHDVNQAALRLKSEYQSLTMNPLADQPKGL